MPNVTLHQNGQVYQQEVNANSNLVVLAGIKKFPHLKYGCGMGKCTKCMVQVVAGADKLQEPNWKENKMLGEKIGEGYRLACQLYISEDIELRQE
ncbi:2Fe-2S iron-sulfur cluster-binding protein [Paenibacillus sp. GCM10023248]|uniref:2Fe-2S iron-sulfur cluster-binding protein n=1 Tax=Bacillales TaxID=1385 RepID=UPI0023789C0B|nr:MULTISPECIES: 2Fe-2S iron-sulfur cluster-binding protein [Bacillales]MDD9266972.1 2Fe-2S iron-sulfur cluster-binding protein [Paenibacillus sp. MAHUQ-63]MDR6881172.1 ferredoxin [Bacillus sp. 3255]